MFVLTWVLLSPTLLVYKYYSCVLIYLRLNIAISCPLTPVLSWTCLAPRALRAWCTHLGLRSLSTSDPPELQRSSSCLTLDPSNSSRISFHPYLTSVPVTGPANMQQTGSQPACRTCHFVTPLAACSDSGWSYVHDTIPTHNPLSHLTSIGNATVHFANLANTMKKGNIVIKIFPKKETLPSTSFPKRKY